MKFLTSLSSLLFVVPPKAYSYSFTLSLRICPFSSTDYIVIESPFIRFISLDPPYLPTLKNFISFYKIRRIKKRMELKDAFLFQNISLFTKNYLVLFLKEKQSTLPSLRSSKKHLFIFWPSILLSLLKKLHSHPLFSDKDTFLFFVYGKDCGLRQFAFLEKTLILSRFHKSQEFSSFEKIKERLHETRLYIERISHKPFHTVPIIALMEENVFFSAPFESVASFSIFPKEALAQLLGLSKFSQNSIEFLILSSLMHKRLSRHNYTHLQSSPLTRKKQLLYGASIFFIATSLILGWNSYEIRKKEILRTELLLQTLASLKEKIHHLAVPSSLDTSLVDQATALAEKQKILYHLQKEPFMLFTKMSSLLGNKWKIDSMSWKLSENLPFKMAVSMKVKPAFPSTSLKTTIEEIEELKAAFLTTFVDLFSASFSSVDSPNSESQEIFPLSLVVEEDINV